MDGIGHISSAHETNLLDGELLLQFCKKLGETDDGCQGIFLIRHHKDLEAASIADGGGLLCKRLALGAAQQHSGAISTHQHSALFKLTAPTGEIPAVCDIQLVKVNNGNVGVLFVQQLDNLINSALCFLLVKVCHNNSS